MSLLGDPMIAGHSNIDRFPGLQKYTHTYRGVRGHGRLPKRTSAQPRTWARERLPSHFRKILPDAARRNIYEFLAPTPRTYAMTPVYTRSKRKKQYKPKKCCRYIRGRKRCSKKYCSKKFYWY